MHVNAFQSGDSHVVAFINQYPESVYVYESILIVHRPVWKHMLFVVFPSLLDACNYIFSY